MVNIPAQHQPNIVTVSMLMLTALQMISHGCRLLVLFNIREKSVFRPFIPVQALTSRGLALPPPSCTITQPTGSCSVWHGAEFETGVGWIGTSFATQSECRAPSLWCPDEREDRRRGFREGGLLDKMIGMPSLKGGALMTRIARD